MWLPIWLRYWYGPPLSSISLLYSIAYALRPPPSPLQPWFWSSSSLENDLKTCLKLYYFSVLLLFNLLHALTEVSIGLPLEKPLLPCLVSSHLSSSTFHFSSTFKCKVNFWNVFFIIGLPPTYLNYRKKEVTSLGPCPKTCLKLLRKSFQNELAGKKIAWRTCFNLIFFLPTLIGRFSTTTVKKKALVRGLSSFVTSPILVLTLRRFGWLPTTQNRQKCSGFRPMKNIMICFLVSESALKGVRLKRCLKAQPT